MPLQCLARTTKKVAKEITDKAKVLTDLARERKEKARRRSKERYDRKTKHKPLDRGDQVYERVPDGLRDKLDPKYKGPLTVLERRKSPSGEPGTSYRCKRKDGSVVEKNYEQLKNRIRKLFGYFIWS